MELPKRKRVRLEGHDYRQRGWYFVTICCDGLHEWLGQVVDGRVFLNDVGAIVEERWLWLGKQCPYVGLGPHVVMPNHVHGLIALPGTRRDEPIGDAGGNGPVATGPYKPKPLSGLIGAFKTTSSKAIHEIGHAEFRWQRSFHDRIVHDDRALRRITNYIRDNPRRWDADSLHG
jgi:REP element-mobilizing transposase RayT